MVRRGYVILALWLASFSAFADVGLDFRGVTPGQLVEGIVKQMLHRDYVVSAEVLKMDAGLTLSVKSVAPDEVLPLLRASLATVGVRVEDRAGVLFIERGAPSSSSSVDSPRPAPVSPSDSAPALSEKEVSVYFPKHRTPEFLGSLVRLAGCTFAAENQASPQSMYFGGTASGVSFMPLASSQASGAQQKRSDVLVYACPKEKEKRLVKLLAEVDRPLAAVNVHAALVEYSTGAEAITSFSAVANLLGSRLGIRIANGSAQSSALTFSGTNLSAVLSAIEGDSRFKSVARPFLRVADGETAKLTVGQDVPVRGQISTDRSGNTLQSIDYKSSGVILSLEPRIFSDSISLKVSHQISSYSATTTSQIDSPTLRKREAQTTVTAAPGDIVVIGGMDSEDESASTSGLSFLPAFLRGSNSSVSRSQVLLFLEVSRDSSI